MMSLYVSSHYKNSPNDLQLMADAPQHHLFVLLGPIDENTTSLPDIYCVVQVALEGSINKQIVQEHLSKGINPSGDLIPYLISRQYQEPEFGSLSGARVVRIATHPEYQRMGYGARSLELLTKYYQREIQNLDEEEDDDEETVQEEEQQADTANVDSATNLNKEFVRPRSRAKLPSLLQTLGERKPEPIQYLGVSYGMTLELFNFWKKNEFKPVYVRMTQNELTGEHTCVMLRAMKTSSMTTQDWLQSFNEDFKRRLITLLGYDFRTFAPSLCLSLLDFRLEEDAQIVQRGVTIEELDMFLFKYDLKRLDAYAKQMLDFHVVMDLVPSIARLFFLKKFPFSLSFVQAAILVGLGLQHKQLEDVQQDLDLQSNQVLALFNKIAKKLVKYLKETEKLRFLKKKQPVEQAVLPKAQPKSNVSLDDAMDIDDEDDKKKKQVNKKVDAEALASVMDDVFEKPLEATNANESKKRKREEQAENAPSAKKPKVEQAPTKKNQIVDKVLAMPGQFAISDNIKTDGDALDEGKITTNDGVVTLAVEEEEQHKRHHFKNKKAVQAQQKQEQDHKMFKKGGKKQRKIKQ